MSEPEKRVKKLIRLKRFEQPRKGYFDDFLEGFQSRRDEEELTKHSTISFGARLAGFFCGMHSGKWIIGAGVAYAAVLVVVLMWPRGPESQPDGSRQPIIYEPKQPVRNYVGPPKDPVSIPGR